MKRTRHVSLVALLAALAATVPVAQAAVPKPVAVFRHSTFGRILALPNHQALYYWQTEKKAHGKIVCTGSCAKLWPPLIVRSAKAVPRTLPGVKGRFGVVRR